MDKKIKAKWVKALRSGGRRQGRGYLRSGRRQCWIRKRDAIESR